MGLNKPEDIPVLISNKFCFCTKKEEKNFYIVYAVCNFDLANLQQCFNAVPWGSVMFEGSISNSAHVPFTKRKLLTELTSAFLSRYMLNRVTY